MWIISWGNWRVDGEEFLFTEESQSITAEETIEVENHHFATLLKNGSGPRFSSLSTIDTLDQIILCCRACSVHGVMFSCIPRLYLLDASSCPPVVTTKTSPHTAKCPEVALVGNHWCRPWSSMTAETMRWKLMRNGTISDSKAVPRGAWGRCGTHDHHPRPSAQAPASPTKQKPEESPLVTSPPPFLPTKLPLLCWNHKSSPGPLSVFSWRLCSLSQVFANAASST